MGHLQCLARGDMNRQWLVHDGGRAQAPITNLNITLNANGVYVPEARLMTHPGLSQTEGEGLYTYPENPTRMRMFTQTPVRRNESLPIRTLGTNILVQKLQLAEDVIFTEVWQGGGREASTFAEMALMFHSFWTTDLPAGELMGWQPRDISPDLRFLVKIVDVRVGSQVWEYQEIQETFGERTNALLDAQLEVDLKRESPVVAPSGSLVLEGV